MSDQTVKSSRRVLDPIDRMSEILFGLIMALTFTCSLSVAEAGQAEVRAMLLGALGCNLAWGLIDGVFYLMGCLAEKAHGLNTLRAVRKSTDPPAAQRLIADSLPSTVAAILHPDELERIRQRLVELPDPPAYARVTGDDRWGAVAVAILVFLATFPVVIPFLLVPDVILALRLSNAVAVMMLFLAGYKLGRSSGRRPWAMGISLVIIGALMVSLCIALGG
jgi:VIT1/CCC1 family predicted Fe2+/Mn2+ transporter